MITVANKSLYQTAILPHSIVTGYISFRRKKMKKYIILLIAIFVLLTASCSTKVDNDEKKKLEDAKSEYLIENLSKNGADEFIVLLSMKYNITIDLTRKILDECIPKDPWNNYSLLSGAKTLTEFEQLKSQFEKSSFEERIKQLSIENHLSQSLIASLLIDYKIWHESIK